MSNILVVKDKVNRYAAALFGSDVGIDADGDLRINVGSTATFVQVVERYSSKEDIELAEKYNLSKSMVRIFAPVLIGLKGTPELFKWVATSQDAMYGHFALNEQEDGSYNLYFEVNMPGDELDQSELNSILMSIAFTADGQDDLLQKQFGGKRLDEL